MAANAFGDALNTVFQTASSATNTLRGAFGGAGGNGGADRLFVYIIAALLVAAIVVMALQIKINWAALDPRPRKYVVTTEAAHFLKPSKQFTNFVVDETTVALSGFKDDGYSIQFECMLLDSRNYTTRSNIYRHILHRGSNELKTSTVAGQIVSRCMAVNAAGLPSEGLPARMNPGIFLDPVTNDILVFVDTMQGAQPYRESVRIADIPLHTPFRMQIVLQGRVLEVYLNCQLEVTKVLAGTPKIVENAWYGLSGGASAQAQLQNLLVWKRPLTVNDIRPICDGAKLPTFASVRPICDLANTPASTAVAGSSAISLGNGVNVSVCSA